MTKLLELDTQRRDAILNAALKEFSLRGYDNASTNVIAKEAGISKALMFHYVSSKQDLFLAVYDYFSDVMEKEYFGLMNYAEKDIFNKLHQSYVLQIELLKKYPWITEFSKLSSVTNSEEINRELKNRKVHSSCYPQLFDEIDITLFRKGLNIEICKQFILWANIGFTNQLLDEIRNSEKNANFDILIKRLDKYFDELRKIFMVIDMNKQYKPTHSKRKKHRKIILFIFIVAVIFSYEVKEWINRRNIMLEMSNPIIVEFPLRGEWLSPNTPGTKIPSHGTNRLGTRYAYDFIQVDWNRTGNPAYRVGLMKYLLFGVQLSDYYCWGQEIYAPCDGIVIVAEDGYIENPKTNLLGDMANAYKNAHYFDPNKDDVQAIAGNYIIIKYSEDIYAAICHLQTGSIQVSVGDTVTKGDIIGKVGHSGNSFAPHLHFQLMDSSDIVTANGVPCAFEEYEVFKNGKWERVTNGIPTSKDRIRFPQSETEVE